MSALLHAVVYYVGGLLGLLAVAMLGSAMGWIEPLDGKGYLVVILGGLALLVGATVSWISQMVTPRPGVALLSRAVTELPFGAIAGVVVVPLYLLTETALPLGTLASLVMAGMGSFFIVWAIRATLSKVKGRH